MASPIIVTGFEPTGGGSLFNQGWGLIDQKVFNKDPAGTSAAASYQDAWVPSVPVFGFDLWPQITIDGLYGQIQSKFRVYYISLWRNPPTLVGVLDYFRAITVQQA